MKNIDIFVHEKYNKADYEKVAEHIYKTYDDSDSKCTDICSKKDSYKSQFVKVKQLNKNNNIATYETVNRKRFTVFSLSKNGKEDTWKKKKEI